MSTSTVSRYFLVAVAGLLVLCLGMRAASAELFKKDKKDDKGLEPKLGSTENEKFFILKVEKSEGIPTLERDLRQRIADELPSSILKSRNLEYIDPSTQRDTASWKTNERGTTLNEASLKIAWDEMRLKWMIILSVSLAPGGRDEKRMLLTGRLMDLEKAHCIISRANLQHELHKSELGKNAKQVHRPIEWVAGRTG